MKDYILGGLITLVVLGLFSLTTTDGHSFSANKREVYNIPIKQKVVVTTDNLITVNKLIKKGYVVQFVTENWWNSSSGSQTTYTLIKY